MSTTTVFESPTALGAKIITISTTITNTSGAYSATITDERLTASMKAIKLELGDPSVFDAVINVAVSNGSLTISCASVTGTSTAVISVLKTCDDPTAITTTEFDVLANRIGDLDDLETTAKTDLVSAVNENSTAISNYIDNGKNKYIENGTDINTVLTPGRYYMPGPSYCQNAPFEGYLDVYVYDSTYANQIAYPMITSYRPQFRAMRSSSWSSWQELATRNDILSGTTTINTNSNGVSTDIVFNESSGTLLGIYDDTSPNGAGFTVIPLRYHTGYKVIVLDGITPWANKTSFPIKYYYIKS